MARSQRQGAVRPSHESHCLGTGGRVCCFCGEARGEPLPPMRVRRVHGPYVDDDGAWFAEDEATCPGLELVDLMLEPVIVQTDLQG